MFDLDFIITALGFIVPIILVILIITQGYVKAPPDHAYIISGLRKQPRVSLLTTSSMLWWMRLPK